jgi:hypothetical protein
MATSAIAWITKENYGGCEWNVSLSSTVLPRPLHVGERWAGIHCTSTSCILLNRTTTEVNKLLPKMQNGAMYLQIEPLNPCEWWCLSSYSCILSSGTDLHAKKLCWVPVQTHMLKTVLSYSCFCKHTMWSMIYNYLFLCQKVQLLFIPTRNIIGVWQN